jgi:hypothetical protein
MNLLVIVLAYKAVWTTSVLGAEGWWGAVASALFLLFLATRRDRPGTRWLILPPLAILFGGLADGTLVATGGLEFTHEPMAFGLPLWMPMLWAAFAGAIPFMLKSLRHRLPYVALLGAVGGPAAYFGAMNLGALEAVAPWAWPVVALEWAVFPVFALWWAFPADKEGSPAPAA